MVSAKTIIQHSPHLRLLRRRLQVFWQPPHFPCPVVGWWPLTKHFVLWFGKLVEGGLDEVAFEMGHVFVPVLNGEV